MSTKTRKIQTFFEQLPVFSVSDYACTGGGEVADLFENPVGLDGFDEGLGDESVTPDYEQAKQFLKEGGVSSSGAGTVTLSSADQAAAKAILGHSYKSSRVRYWKSGKKTAKQADPAKNENATLVSDP